MAEEGFLKGRIAADLNDREAVFDANHLVQIAGLQKQHRGAGTGCVAKGAQPTTVVKKLIRIAKKANN